MSRFVLGNCIDVISQIFSGEPDMYILRRDTPIMIVSYQGWSGGHAACPLHSPE